MSTSIDDIIANTHRYFPAVKFEKVGDTVTGDVLDAWQQDKLKFGTTEVDRWDDGSAKQQLVVNLLVNGEEATLYTKPPAQNAIFDAVRRSKGKLGEGGTLTVTRVADKPSKTKGFKPAQQFEAEFTPNDASAADLDGV